jgi:hypothetical protein
VRGMGLAWRKRSGAAAKKEERGRGYANRICGCYGLVGGLGLTPCPFLPSFFFSPFMLLIWCFYMGIWPHLTSSRR